MARASTGTDPSRPQSQNSKTIMLIIAFMVGSVGAFMTSALNVALQAINQEYKPDAILLNWVVTSFVLSMAVFSIPGGRLADIIGLKRLTIYGVFVFLAGTILAAFSNSIILLIGARVIQGAGVAMINATMVAMLTMTFPFNERGRALGIYISSIYAWLAAGPLLGGLLTDHAYLGWRSIFLFAIPFSLVMLVLLFWKVKGEWALSRGEKFDYTGSLIFGLALVALIYGFSKLPGVEGILLTLIGVFGIVIFLFWENYVESPILNVKIFKRNKAFIFSNLASLINYSATFSISYFISLYLQLIKGYSAEQAGLILIAQPLIQTLISPFTGRLSDRVEPRLVASAGMTLIFLGILSFAFLTDRTSLVQVIVTLIVLGIGFGLFVPPNTNAIMSSVAPKYYAVASSVTGTMRTIGQTLSMGIALVVTAVVIGSVVVTRDYHPGFLTSTRIAFVIFAVLCLAGIFASLSRGKKES
ncbi:MAG TPA: MFS transporter [Dehalococcoidales bacterium]